MPLLTPEARQRRIAKCEEEIDRISEQMRCEREKLKEDIRQRQKRTKDTLTALAMRSRRMKAKMKTLSDPKKDFHLRPIPTYDDVGKR
jgi:hypothetical protein